MTQKTRIITLGNQKGGCAKSTNCLNICYSLANTFNKRVLLVDMDSQASASINLGLDVGDDSINTIDEILGEYVENPSGDWKDWENVKKYIYTPTFPKRIRVEGSTKWETKNIPFGKDISNGEGEGCFDLIPSNLALAVVELRMSMRASSNRKGTVYSYYLRDLLDVIIKNKDEAGEHYDYVIIDTPPALGSLSFNSIACAVDGVIIPTNLDLMSFRGIKSFEESVEAAKKLNPNHKGILGILLSLYFDKRAVDNALAKYIEEFYPIPVFKTQIPDSTDAKRANASGLLFSQVNKKAKKAFDELCKEIMDAVGDAY